MTNKKFDVGDKVRVKRYPKIPKKVAEHYSGKIGEIIGMRHIKGRLWYRVSFGELFYGPDLEEFTSGELTRV